MGRQYLQCWSQIRTLWFLIIPWNLYHVGLSCHWWKLGYQRFPLIRRRKQFRRTRLSYFIYWMWIWRRIFQLMWKCSWFLYCWLDQLSSLCLGTRRMDRHFIRRRWLRWRISCIHWTCWMFGRWTQLQFNKNPLPQHEHKIITQLKKCKPFESIKSRRCWSTLSKRFLLSFKKKFP